MAVLHLRQFRKRRGPYTVYGLPPDVARIDRRTPYGNPFELGAVDPEQSWAQMGRDRVLVLFRHYAIDRLIREPEWLDPLFDMRLACWCAPRRCHGEVLLELIAVVRAARAVMVRSAVSAWLSAPAPIFEGLAPRDVIATGNSALVVSTLEAIAAGTFT